MALGSCAGNADLPVSAGTGPQPVLPPPKDSLLPLVNVAKAQGWVGGETPVAAAGLTVAAFATGLDHPRWLYGLPNGDILVAETNAQEKKPKGLYQRVQRWVMKRAGAVGKSADRITLLRDADGDGIAETAHALITGLTSPFGMSLVGDRLYVANTDGIVSFPYSTGQTKIVAAPTPLVPLPANDPNYHWTKNLLASADGQRLYASVGSNSDHAEGGLENETGRAAIWEINIDTAESRIFASGLRNPVGMAFEPSTGVLWTTVNERDDLGGDLVPDYMTSVTDGSFYGWPYSYYGDNQDPRVEVQEPELVAAAKVPDYALGPIPPRSGSALPTKRRSGHDGRKAPSLASMAHGTANLAVATRSFSCRSATANHRDNLKTCSQAFSMKTARRAADRSAWLSISAAQYWLRTTLAIRSGASLDQISTGHRANFTKRKFPAAGLSFLAIRRLFDGYEIALQYPEALQSSVAQTYPEEAKT